MLNTDPFKLLQETWNNNKNLASERDPYAKPLFAKYAGLENSISESAQQPTRAAEVAERVQFEKEYTGLSTLKALGNLGFERVDDTGSRFNRGYSAMRDMMATTSTQGWGERNPYREKIRLSMAEGDSSGFIKPSDEMGTWQDRKEGISAWYDGLVEHTEKLFHTTELEGEYEKLKWRLAQEDPQWTEAKKQESLQQWKTQFPEAYDFTVRAGVDLNRVVAGTLNETAFNVVIMDSVKQAIVNRRMRIWEEDNNAVIKFLSTAAEGFKDPAMVRDIIATSALTLGLATPQVIGARLGVATTQASSLALGSAKLLQLTGPMTGLIEGPAYAALRGTLFRQAGRTATDTLMARGLAMFAEGTTAGVLSALEDQRDNYEWRSLAFRDTENLFKYDYKQAISTGLQSGTGAMLMLGMFRFGLGALGDFKYYSKGDWSNWGRSIANSLDTWAETKEGLTVFGETLSDGRGMFFGNVLDRYMAGKDGRNFANVMLNGDRLFGRFDPVIAAKMNLDTKAALEVADAFEAATGIAGEAAMRRLDGVDPAFSNVYSLLLNKKFLEDQDLSYSEVSGLLKDYTNFSRNKGVGPLPDTGVGRLLKALPNTARKTASEISRVLDLRILDKKLSKNGISSGVALNTAESAIGRTLDLMADTDFRSYRTTAAFLDGATREEGLVNSLNGLLNSDTEMINIGGREIPRDVAKTAVRTALGLDERSDLLYINDAGEADKASFVVMVDPKTNEVLKTRRELKTNDKGELEISFAAKDNASYKPENVVSNVDFAAKVADINKKLQEGWVSWTVKKIKKAIGEVKDPAKKAELEKSFEQLFSEGLTPTVENIAKVFNMNKTEATVANIIMRSLGYDPNEHLLRIARGAVDEGATGNIVLLGTQAIINATKASDLGTIGHEMGHYNRYIFGQDTEDSKAARHAIGITDDMWDKFKDWCGVVDGEWTVKAEEKFANGWAFYIRNVMSGNGKAPTTQIQRLFHRLGDHLGNLGERFKSQVDLEKDLAMTPLAEEVFEKLLIRSNDKISELFDVSYHRIFKRLPKDKRAELGVEILGEMAWNDYRAKIEKSIAESRVKTDPVLAGAAAPRVSFATVVSSISAELSGTTTKKNIREAAKAGLKKETILSQLEELVPKINSTLGSLSSVLEPADQTVKRVFRSSRLNSVPESTLTAAFADPAVENVTFVVGHDAVFNNKTMKFELIYATMSVSRKQATTFIEMKNKKEITPVAEATDSATADEILDALDSLSSSTGFVDSVGIPVELTSTEAMVATLKAVAVAETTATVETASAIATDLSTRSPEEILAYTTPEETASTGIAVFESAEINVEIPEADVSSVPETVATLVSVQAEAVRVTNELTPEQQAQVKAFAALALSNPERVQELLKMWKDYFATGKETETRPAIEYLAAEMKNIIAKNTLDTLTGMTDEGLIRFVTIKEKLNRFLDTPEYDKLVLNKDIDGFTAKHPDISKEDLELYLVGLDHIHAQLERAEYMSASRIVNNDASAYQAAVAFVSENEAEYSAALARKSDSDKDLIKKVKAAKTVVTKYENARKRVSLGVLGKEVVDVGAVAVVKKDGMFNLENFNSYRRIFDIYQGVDDYLSSKGTAIDVGIDDLLEEFDKDSILSEQIGYRLGVAGDENRREAALAWASGETSYNGIDFTKDQLSQVKSYLRGVIKKMHQNKAGKGTKKGKESLTGEVDGKPVDRAATMTTSGRETKSLSNIAANTESNLLLYTTSLLYERLKADGEHKLAEYLAARRATYWMPGNREDNLRSAFELRGNELGLEALNEKTVDALEQQLVRRIQDFANDLRVLGLGAAADVVTTTKLGMDKVVVFNQGPLSSLEQLSDFIARGVEANPAGFTTEVPTFLREMLNISKSHSSESGSILTKIEQGFIKNGEDLLLTVMRSNDPIAPLASALYNKPGVKELLKKTAVMLVLDRYGQAIYSARAGVIGFNPALPFEHRVAMHELLHAITREKLFFDGLFITQELEGMEYLDALDALINTADFPESDKLILKSYFNYVGNVLPSELLPYVNNFREFDRIQNEDPSLAKYYAGLNVDEFIAECFTNVYTIRDVLSIRVPGQVTAENASEEVTTFIRALLSAARINVNDGNINAVYSTLLPTATKSVIDLLSEESLARQVAEYPTDINKFIDTEPLSFEEGNIFFRVDQSNLVFLSNYVHARKDPRLFGSPRTFNQGLTDGRAATQLKARADLKASKGRVYTTLRTLNQNSNTVSKFGSPEEYKVTGGALGSNKAKQLLHEPSNEKYYVKEAKSLLHAQNEALAQHLYTLMGFNSVKSTVVEQGEWGLNGPMLFTPWLKETTKMTDTNPQHVEQAKKLFITSAWLANWDVFGLNDYDNVDGFGTVLDTGGSLLFRAQGQPKGAAFGNDVTELSTFLDSFKAYMASKIFTQVTDAEKIEQAIQLKQTMTDDIITDMVYTFISDPDKASELRNTLIARRESIYKKIVPETVVQNDLQKTIGVSEKQDDSFIGDDDPLYKEIDKALGVYAPFWYKEGFSGAHDEIVYVIDEVLQKWLDVDWSTFNPHPWVSKVKVEVSDNFLAVKKNGKLSFVDPDNSSVIEQADTVYAIPQKQFVDAVITKLLKQSYGLDLADSLKEKLSFISPISMLTAAEIYLDIILSAEKNSTSNVKTYISTPVAVENNEVVVTKLPEDELQSQLLLWDPAPQIQTPEYKEGLDVWNLVTKSVSILSVYPNIAKRKKARKIFARLFELGHNTNLRPSYILHLVDNLSLLSDADLSKTFALLLNGKKPEVDLFNFDMPNVRAVMKNASDDVQEHTLNSLIELSYLTPEQKKYLFSVYSSLEHVGASIPLKTLVDIYNTVLADNSKFEDWVVNRINTDNVFEKTWVDINPLKKKIEIPKLSETSRDKTSWIEDVIFQGTNSYSLKRNNDRSPSFNKAVAGLVEYYRRAGKDRKTQDALEPMFFSILETVGPDRLENVKKALEIFWDRYVISGNSAKRNEAIEWWERNFGDENSHTEASLFNIAEALKRAEIEDWSNGQSFVDLLLKKKNLRSEETRNYAFKTIAGIKRNFNKKKLSEEQRAVNFKEFFTDENGNNLLWKDSFGLPVLFYRGQGLTIPDLEGSLDVGYRFWGESSRVARDYGHGQPIISAYLRADSKQVLVIKINTPTHWSEIPTSAILKALDSYGEGALHLKELFQAMGKTSTDDIATKLLTTNNSPFVAVAMTNLLDYTTEGGVNVPHSQWVIRSDKNVMKSPEAIEFDKTPGPMRILNQKRAQELIETAINSAKAAGGSSKELEAELANLVDSAAVRRRNLLDMKLHEETEPEDLKIISDMIAGNDAFTSVDMSKFMDRFTSSPKKTLADSSMKFRGRSYRDLDEKERREFVLDVMMPKISNELGVRNKTAGVFSALSDGVVGRKANSLIGGAARYGDTADSTSVSLQFLSKILDPAMDLRDGELDNTFRLFSVDLINAELNNTYSRSGLLAIKNKIQARIQNAAELNKFNDMAWMYLSRSDEIPEDAPNKDLLVELISAVHKHNELSSDILNKYGNLAEPMDPKKYGTMHKVNNLAFRDQAGFVKALTEHAIAKTMENRELSLVTAEALGWVSLKRATGATDEILSVKVLEGSPIKLEPKEYEWNNETRKLFGSKSMDTLLPKEQHAKYIKGLTSSEDYVDSYKRLYARRGQDYSAIKQTMTIAKDRYLGVEDGDTKTGKPRSESIGSGRNFNDERILSHTDITKNPELARYFQKDIFDLIYQQIRSQLTEATMTKYISEYFGVKMSWNDLVNILRKSGEESQDKANLSAAEQESRTRGFNRMEDIWEYNTGRMVRSKDGLDKYYEALTSNSRVPVLVLGGLKAALSSVGEVGRAVLASNHNKGMLRQVVPNFVQLLKTFSGDKRKTVLEVTSATHWLRNISSDHLLARSEVHPENPFGGAMLGSRQGGWFKRWAEDWRAISDINASETNMATRGLNRLGMVASRLGAPLAWVNDVTTTLHVWNAQRNLTENSSKFMQLAKKLENNKELNLGSFARLAKECGLTAKEALNLSTAGLLDPAVIEVMVAAAKDTANYSDGLLDVQKLFVWAGEDPVKIDAINKMGAYINTTARQTNTDPTLLDLRINQSAYAKAFGVFMQFLLSHSVQEIGRRRRYTTASYGRHVAGLVIMEALTYSLARQKEDDKWIWEEANEKPIDVTLRMMTSLPMLGSYQYLGSLLRQILQGGYNALQGDEFGKVNIPDLFSAPAENIPSKAWDIFRDML